MELTGQQFHLLQQALLSAFPSRAALRQLMRVQFDLVLENVADGSNDSEVVFQLITWAESQGRLEELLSKARQENPGNPKLKAFAAEVLEPAALPVPPPATAADLAQWVTIHDSGAEGTNAALAVVTAMETMLAAQGHPQTLSVRYLHEKAKRHDEQAETSEGTFLEATIYVAEQFGVPPESAWPYKAGARALPAGQTWATLNAQARQLARFYRLSSYEEIAVHLRQNRPVVAGLPIYEAWLGEDAKASGEIPMPAAGTPSIGGHAIVITAINPQPGTLRFANVWGSGWGQGGFGQMSEAVARAHLFNPAIQDKLWAVGPAR